MFEKEEEIRKLAEDYIDSCTKKSGFVILAERLKGDFIDLFVAGFMKCLEINKANEWQEQVQKATEEQLTKAKELLAKWVELFKPKGGNIPPTPIQEQTEQFLSEVEK